MIWTRERFESIERRRVGRRSMVKPEVWSADDPSGRVAVKDSSQVRNGFRWLGRYLVRREPRALRRLVGMKGVPQFQGMLDRDAFACSWLDGGTFDLDGFEQDPRGIARQMRCMVEEMHGHGVFHLDLRQRQNLLLTSDGELAFVDFGAAVVLRPWVHTVLGRFFAWIDHQAVCKWVARFAPEELSRAEARTIVNARWWRQIWFLSPHKDRGELAVAKARLESGN